MSDVPRPATVEQPPAGVDVPTAAQPAIDPTDVDAGRDGADPPPVPVPEPPLPPPGPRRDRRVPDDSTATVPEPPTGSEPTAPARGGSVVVPGQRIASRYRVTSLIAAGGMAQVWRAEDEVLARPVAVKVLRPHLAADPAFVARFRREAVAAARLAHSKIVATYDTCTDPEAIVMELVEGRTLRDELDRQSFLPTDQALSVAADVADALEVAHRAGLIHRDVKPANVLLGIDGQVKVTDFGVAKAAVPDDELPDLTSVGALVGTAKYLAPEQVRGEPVDARTDVYALGIVLYEMLCGRAPFVRDNDQATAVARLQGPPPSPRSVLRTIPERVAAIVMKALAPDPDSRYSSAAAFRADLLAVDPSEKVPASVPVVDATATLEGQSPLEFAKAEGGWLVPTLFVSLVAVALGVAWLLIGGSDARRDVIDFVDRVTPGEIRDSSPDDDTPEPVDAAPLPARALAFDPLGGDGENNDLAANVVDGDATTTWATERYNSADLGGLKPGVGIVVELDQARRLTTVDLLAANTGWQAEIYVADTPAPRLEGWGAPVATFTIEGPGPREFPLDVDESGETIDRQGGAVLVWITRLGATDDRFRAEIAEITVHGV